MINYKELLAEITTFVFDYDGVLSDGIVMLQSDGDQLRTANVKDGYALQLVVKLGYNVAVITGGNSISVQKRCEGLGIEDAFLGVSSKPEVLNSYMERKNIDPRQVVYMGDDIPDYKAMQMVGLPCCPADASNEIKSISKYISDKNGGQGCVRDIIEQTLKVQNKWMTKMSHHW